MDIVEALPGTTFTVVGITATVVVPAGSVNSGTDATRVTVDSQVLQALLSALSAGCTTLQLAPDAAASATDHSPYPPVPVPALRSVPTRPDVGTRASRVHTSLTDREREVLCLVASGATNGAIASRLFISPKTASVHVSRILTKLDATTRTEAAALAHASGLVRPGDLDDVRAANQ